MGTRNLTIVKKNNQYKVAQYGQWDGYPSGQGQHIVDFLLKLNEYRDEFEKKLELCEYINLNDKELVDKINSNFKNYPQFSRDTASEILDFIKNYDGDKILLKNDLDFVKDSLFCEWAYVIDMDNNQLEIYEGFNKTPLTEEDRFYDVSNSGGYYPVKILTSYKFEDLPENLYLDLKNKKLIFIEDDD